MGNNFYDYALSLSPKLFHPYSKGHINDLSGGSHNGTLVNNPQWERANRRLGLRFDNTEYLTVPSHADLALTSGTILVFGRMCNNSHKNQTQRIVYHGHYGLFFYAPVVGGSTRLYANGNISSMLAVDPDNARCVAVTFPGAGSAPKFYINGTYAGDGNNAQTLSGTAGTLYIGGQGSHPARGVVNDVLIYNSPITDTQISTLYQLWTYGSCCGITKYFYMDVANDRELDTGCVMNMIPVQQDGSIVFPDASGSGNDGTPDGGYITKGLYGTCIEFPGSDATKNEIDCGGDSSLAFTGSYSLEMAFELTQTGSQQRLFCRQSGVPEGYVLEVTAGDFLSLDHDGNTVTGNVALHANCFYHVVSTYDSSDDSVVIYLNGEVYKSDTMAGGAATDSGGNLKLGLDVSADQYPFGGRIHYAKAFDGSVLSATEVARRFRLASRKMMYYDSLCGYPVSTGNIAAGNDLGPFTIIAGTHKFSWDGTDKWLECVTAGDLSANMSEAYGTWQFSVYKGNTANDLKVGFIQQTTDLATSGGYVLTLDSTEAILLDCTGVGNVMTTAAAYISNTTKYTFRITRTHEGVFTAYVIGGAFTTWTQVVVTGGSNPGTENTVQSGGFINLDLDAGDKVSNFSVWAGILSPSDMPEESR